MPKCRNCSSVTIPTVHGFALCVPLRRASYKRRNSDSLGFRCWALPSSNGNPRAKGHPRAKGLMLHRKKGRELLGE